VEDILCTIFSNLQGGIMRTVIAVASVVVLLGMIVAGWSRARPDRRELPRIHW